jgi:hypothetical protein
MVQDWTARHAVYAWSGPAEKMFAAQRDPRAVWSWESAFKSRGFPWLGFPDPFRFWPHRPERFRWHRDWSISLGSPGVAPNTYPAKFTFDVNATPDCTNDFVVYALNTHGSATQANLVAFKALYSGTSPAGICNRGQTPADVGTTAVVDWAVLVATSGVNGSLSTSPSLSLDGAKVAFVESASLTPAEFHVLAWAAGAGFDNTNWQSVASPSIVNSFVPIAPKEGSGNATHLTLGSSATDSDTLSSPFVDYGSDVAYVGNDGGKLFRIKDVFCTVDPACTGSTPPVPSLDTTWGTNGVVTVGSGSCAGTPTSVLTGPVEDSVTGNVFVGCADGKLYGFDSTGAPLTIPSVTVGDGTTDGGVVDPPIVDSVNGFVYATSGSASGGTAVLVQAKTDLSSPLTATLGMGGVHNLYDGAFNDAYFSSATSTAWQFYAQGYDGAGANALLYGAAFNADRTLVTGTPANSLALPGGALEWSPLTEVLNGTTDELFLGSIATAGTLDAFTINTFPAGTSATSSQPGGPSGIVVDNVSTQNQASSIYFSDLGTSTCQAPSSATGYCAVKLTQAGLL